MYPIPDLEVRTSSIRDIASHNLTVINRLKTCKLLSVPRSKDSFPRL